MKRYHILVVGIVLLVLGCRDETRDRLAKIEERVNSVDSLLELQGRMLPGYARLGPMITYQLSDLERDRKNVGWVYSKHSFAKGDRIFLGDDIWEVAYVKAFTTKRSGFKFSWEEDSALTQQPDKYDINLIELLVKFGGKATDPKPQQ